jgi:hypothetical protein
MTASYTQGATNLTDMSFHPAIEAGFANWAATRTVFITCAACQALES